jgi:hypothetical protein
MLFYCVIPTLHFECLHNLNQRWVNTYTDSGIIPYLTTKSLIIQSLADMTAIGDSEDDVSHYYSSS